MRLPTIYMNYKKIKNEFKSLNISKKDKFIALLFSFILSFLIILGPLTILINYLVYTKYLNLIYFLIATLASIFIYLIFMFYYKFISDDKIKGIYYRAFINSLIFWIIIYIILIIIYHI